MKTYRYKQLQGVSLLELLFVLAIAAALIMAGIGRYQQQQRGTELSGIENNVQVIFAAFASNYRQYCVEKSPPESSYTTADYLNPTDTQKNVIEETKNKLLRTPLVTDYTVFAKLVGLQKDTDKPIFNLQVTVTLDPEKVTQADMEWYQSRLGAEWTRGTNNLTWTHMPNYDLVTLKSGAWGSSMGLRFYKRFMLQHTMQPPIPDTSCAY